MTKKLFSACLFLAAATCAFAQKSRVYIATDFTKVNYSLPIDIYVSVGSSFEIKATGTASDIDQIVVEKKGNALVIKSKNRYPKFSNKSAKVLVSMPALEALSVAGSGDAYTKNPIKGDYLNLSIAGSGSISIESASINKMEVSIAGSGDITIAEQSLAENANISIAGSGEVNAKELHAKNVEASIAGSGDVICYASESVKAQVAGSGSITCYGNPRNVEKKKMGSGNISIK